jgi:glycosyltransferase involved in cell wall biosynthesis
MERDKNTDLTICFAGRIIDFKGITIALQSVSILMKKYTDLRFAIAGDGPLRPKLMEEFNDVRHIWLGQLTHKELLDLFRASQIYIFPVLRPEGFGLTVVEAAVMGCAVIVSDIPSMREIVRDDSFGMFFDPHQSNALVNALEFLVQNPVERKKLAGNLHQRVINTFAWKTTIDKFENFLDKALV